MTTIAPGDPTAELDLDSPVRLYPLTFLDEGEEVTVGRADVDSYCVLPADGAALLRELEQGRTPRDAARWYSETYGENVDVAEFLAAMEELEFVVAEGATVADTRPVRWQRLGMAVFSPVAWLVYAAVIGAAVLTMVRQPDLAPHYKHLFFTPYMTVMELVLFVGQFPFVLLHESFHALAGRRLGLRSRLSIGRRLYFIVFETSLDGLVTVPRRKRYVPMLVGLLADALVVSVLTLIAAVVRTPDGGMPILGGICLALAFGTVLRIIWQFYFYLQTDTYHVIVTVLGCVDLQKTARRMVRNRLNRLIGRRHKVIDESTFHPRDRAVARWYSWLLAVGYTLSIATLLLAALPSMVRILGNVFGRLVSGNAGGIAGIADSTVFLLLNIAQIAIVLALMGRERRLRRATAATSHLID
jgi:hypothetical protein